MPDRQFGPFQLAANKLKQFAIENNVPNAAHIKLDGLLGEDWDEALRAIMKDGSLRSQFDYGILRKVRDDPALGMSWFRFVGSIGQTFPGPFQFLEIIAARADEEARGAKPTNVHILCNRACGWSDQSINWFIA